MKTEAMTLSKIFISLQGINFASLPKSIVVGAILGFCAFVLSVMFIMYLSRTLSKPEEKQVTVVHYPPDLHLHIKDLKEAIVREMKVTSKQNWIMIILTIIFITLSVFGGVLFMLIKNVPHFLPQVFKLLKGLVGR